MFNSVHLASFLLSCLSILLASSSEVPSTYLSISSNKRKCVSLSSTKGTTIDIVYSTPDLIYAPPDDIEFQMNNAAQRHAASKIENSHSHARALNPLAHYSQMMNSDGIAHMKDHHNILAHTMDYFSGGDKQLNANANAATSPGKDDSNISLVVENIRTKSFMQNRPHRDEMKSEFFQLVQKDGKIRYKLKHYDYARICVQSLTASVRKPTFLSIRVKEVDEAHLDLDDVDQKDGLTNKERKERKKENDKGMEHLRWLEREMHHIISRVDSLERACHTSKQSHHEFYSQSVKMHGNMKWFSIAQLIILMVTGALNARAVIKRLEKKFCY